MFALGVDQELQTIVLRSKVFQQYLLRFAVGLVHVVDQKRLEVTRHHPFGVLTLTHVHDIKFRLQERSYVAIATLHWFAQVDIDGLLLDEYLC